MRVALLLFLRGKLAEIWNIRKELMEFKSAGYLLKKKEKILENWKTNILWQVSSELCIV